VVAGTYALLGKSPFTDAYNKSDYANSSIYQVTSGAWVFGAGSMYWNWGLDNYVAPASITTYAVAAPSAALQAATANIINLFLAGGGTNPLAGPTNLTATATTNSVTLTWTDNTTLATAYSVQRSPDGSAWTTLTTSLSATATTYTDSPGAGAWYYRVQATDNSGDVSPFSNIVYIATLPTAPQSLVAAGSMSALAINLSWTDTAVTETAYDVDRSADGGTSWMTLTSTLPANTQAYSDTTVAPATPYSYRVKATNSTGSSGYSNIASATSPNGPPPPLAPSGLTATVKGGGHPKIGLSWKDNATNATNYVIDRSTDQIHWTRLTSSLSASATSYTDNSVARHTQYFYRVGAINASNASSPSYSNIASATTA
jgi:hypothetical protein